MIDMLVKLVCVGCVLALSMTAPGMSPEDERVSGYLGEHELDGLLEVQLFDRLNNERDAIEREKVAGQLGGLYLEQIAQDELSDRERKAVLLKGRVLVGMMPADQLLGLRLELLVHFYKEYEQAADLDRIGLLDSSAKEAAVEALKTILPDLARIVVIADVQIQHLDRSASRSSGKSLEVIEQELSEARRIRSRASFFHGWAGLSQAALSDTKVGGDIFKAFGRVLGFDGRLPVLDRVDDDLLEYDHVARSMLGVAMCKMQNGETGETRVWLTSVENSTVAPDFAIHFALQRLLEVSLAELDWIESERQAIYLRDFENDSLLGVAQARLLVLKTMEQIGSREKGKGGREGAMELARMGLDRLVDLGEIGHILDLRTRFGSLPMLDSGFVSLYTQGLSELADGDESGGMVSYTQASVKFGQALGSSDVERYGVHAGDAALKLAYCEMRRGRPGDAVDVLTQHSGLMQSENQQEESEWLMILAHDAGVRGGQDQLSERLTALIGEYIRGYPSSERANVLIVRYAMTPHLEAGDSFGSLAIDDPSDPIAVPARRKLVQLLYKNPGLIEGGDEELFGVLRGHAEWLWRNETKEFVNVRDGRERLAVCRIVIGAGIGLESVEHGFLLGVIDRAEGIMDGEPSLDGSRSELAFRRVQVLLLMGEIERGGEIALDGGTLDESVRAIALLMVYEQADRRFRGSASVPSAQAVVRYGRGVIDASVEELSEGLDDRLSLVAEGMAGAAEYLGERMNDGAMREYALALSLRIFHEGTPSAGGLVRTAVLGEEFGHSDIALECWLKLVGQLSEAQDSWHRARFESLRLLMAIDPERGLAVHRQYAALYPEGSPEPWGTRIDGLFVGSGVGEP